MREAIHVVADQRVVRQSGLFSIHETSYLRRLFAALDIDCVIDVGANRGQYARRLRDDAGYRGRIISFEPDPAMAEALRGFARHDPMWAIREVALSDTNGVQRLNIMRDREFNSLRNPRHDETDLFTASNEVVSTVEVRCETLESALEGIAAAKPFERPFLKLDVQGHEHAILAASEGVLRRFVGLQVEIAMKGIYAGHVGFAESLEWMTRRGFDVGAIVPNNDARGHFPLLIEADCILVRSDLVATARGGR